MSGFITRLAARLDTLGAASKMARFRNGWPATASPNVKFHRTARAQYRYCDAGIGPTIIFAVDGPMTIEVYGQLIATFTTRFRVVIIEMPAMGFSVASTKFDFEFQSTNDDLASFIREVCGEGNILAFSCVTSLAALDIAARMPELVTHLTLIQAGGTHAFARFKAGRDPKGILAKPIFGQLAMARLAPKRMPHWYALSVGRKEQIPQLCECAERSFKQGAMWSLASAFQIYMAKRDELPQPHQPILSIWGAADGSHPEGNAHSLARLYDGVACVTFEDLGHTPEIEDPRAVFAAITDFLDSR
jgi:pimeloyl-ACP methyl ester carboxylesterase